MLLYVENVLKNHTISTGNYRDRDESLFLFDYEKSKNDLAHMIDSYDPKTQGILILISSDHQNATWFVTVAMKSR